MSAGASRDFAFAVLARELVRDVASVLAPAGIEVMPLKGVLLQQVAYADPSERPLSDVDVLVPPGALDAACDVLLARGYASRTAWSDAIAHALRPPRSPFFLDLHGELFGFGLFSLDARAVFARSTADAVSFDAPVRLPHPLDAYAHVVGHFAKARLGPEAAPQLGDLRALARRYELAPRTVARHLEAHGLARAARYTLLTAAEDGDAFGAAVLDALAPDAVGERLVETLRAFLAERPHHDRAAGAAVHALDRSLPRAVASCARHTWWTAKAYVRRAPVDRLRVRRTSQRASRRKPA